MIIEKMPNYYKKSPFMAILNLAINDEKDRFEKYLNDNRKEFFIKTTSNYIYDWEREFSVPSYLEQDLFTRRGNVLGRFRGYGTSNKSFIRKVVEGFFEGEVIDIVEDFDKSLITMYFKTKKGLPENYQELQRTIEELMPCHLEYAYKFIFALDSYSHKELEPYEYRVLEGAIHSGGMK